MTPSPQAGEGAQAVPCCVNSLPPLLADDVRAPDPRACRSDVHAVPVFFAPPPPRLPNPRLPGASGPTVRLSCLRRLRRPKEGAELQRLLAHHADPPPAIA
eukprot:CAMPEP_0170607194 /NCGR_PEP_ID=MMETSP0224-20130122/20922_1 /TAXON_ID=285029 /ORGANISM="Togula jolla, Strain CCCM 725" /LENGTH=100 /DNA_ID=CAMNT_0010932339 /DNA_START=631 /DNA_END=933 /DNA_ORIENTATION=-